MGGDHRKPTDPQNLAPSASNSKVSGEIGGSTHGGHKPNYPNPPDISNPDAATLRDQWKYAVRQYSKWYSHAWGTAILAGVSFFALGWIIKGSNPLPSFKNKQEQGDSANPTGSDDVTEVNQAR